LWINFRAKTKKYRYDCERWREGIEDILAAADYVIPSAEFLEVVELKLSSAPLKEKIFQLSKIVHGNLIVTNGEDGAYYLVEGSLYHVTVPNVHAVDTIGAGDNFHAAFAFALTKGFDLHQTVSFSVAVASLSCREYGGRKGVPMMNAALKVANALAVKIVG